VRTRRGAGVALVAGVAGVVLLHGAPSGAIRCGPEEQAYVYEYSSGNDRYNGAETRNMIRDAPTEVACGEKHSTAFMWARDNSGRYAEVGWTAYYTTTGIKVWRVFTEIRDEDFRVTYQETPILCCRWSRFRVVYGGSGRWKFYFDYENDGTYILLGPSNGLYVGFNEGFAMGETGRFGGTNTNGYDHHVGLLRRFPGASPPLASLGAAEPLVQHDNRVPLALQEGERV
jgi:hypothetical protein